MKFISAPIECLEIGCKEKSDKCFNCGYNYLPWFSWVAKLPVKCYNKWKKESTADFKI